MAIIDSQIGDILTDLTTSCRVNFFEMGAILDKSHTMTSDLTEAAISKLLKRLQSADERGPPPQSKLSIGWKIRANFKNQVIFQKKFQLTWYETTFMMCKTPLFSATMSLETSSGCQDSAMMGELKVIVSILRPVIASQRATV